MSDEDKPKDAATPQRFREEPDPEPYIDPSGVTRPLLAIDVLDPREYSEYMRERSRR